MRASRILAISSLRSRSVPSTTAIRPSHTHIQRRHFFGTFLQLIGGVTVGLATIMTGGLLYGMYKLKQIRGHSPAQMHTPGDLSGTHMSNVFQGFHRLFRIPTDILKDAPRKLINEDEVLRDRYGGVMDFTTDEFISYENGEYAGRYTISNGQIQGVAHVRAAGDGRHPVLQQVWVEMADGFRHTVYPPESPHFFENDGFEESGRVVDASWKEHRDKRP